MDGIIFLFLNSDSEFLNALSVRGRIYRQGNGIREDCVNTLFNFWGVFLADWEIADYSITQTV